jgi:hypothetical protein
LNARHGGNAASVDRDPFSTTLAPGSKLGHAAAQFVNLAMRNHPPSLAHMISEISHSLSRGTAKSNRLPPENAPMLSG